VTRWVRILAVTVLAVVLALSAAQNAFSSQWIIYDNNSQSNDELLGTFVGVRFSLPNGVSSAHLLAVSFYWIEEGTSVQGAGMVMAMSPQDLLNVVVHITGVPPSTATELTSPILLTPIIGWNPVDVSSSNIVVSGDFYVAIEQPFRTVAFDSSSSNFEGRSVYGDSLDHVTDSECCNEVGGGFGLHNFMIRAEIDPIVSPAPVGGFMEPVNKLVVFAPYLALFGVLAVIVIAARPWKKRGN
jgi:hypothetical protein